MAKEAMARVEEGPAYGPGAGNRKAKGEPETLSVVEAREGKL